MNKKFSLLWALMAALVLSTACGGGSRPCKDDKCKGPTTPPVCTVSVDISSHTFGCDGGELRAKLLTPAGCTISGTVTSSASWLMVSQSGNEFVTTAPRNESGAKRTADVSINGTRVATYTQEACAITPTCTYSTNQSSFNFDWQGRTGTIVVNASNAGCPACTEVPSNLPSWLTLVSQGGGNFTYVLTDNGDMQNARSTTFTICGISFVFSQGPKPMSQCHFSVPPFTATFPAQGEDANAQFNVNTTPDNGCPWTAAVTKGNAWLAIRTGTSGAGDGIVTLYVGGNPGGPREGEITITSTATGETFVTKVPQEGN